MKGRLAFAKYRPQIAEASSCLSRESWARMQRMKSRAIFFLPAICLAFCLQAQAQDLSKFFKNTTGAFVLYDLKNDRYLRHNPARCKQRLPPHSTFKIPNSLIGLETGVIADADFVIPWDRQKYPPETAY